ncbi:MAG: aspartate/glutamate racemase family protein [Pseudomonadota bacterium]
MIAQGGKQIYGAPIGILMLDAQFPRIPGDMGNAETWPFPVLYRVVEDASPDRIVRRGAEGMLEPFIAAGRDLIRQGAEAITTNCGFLSLFQAELSAALGVPVLTSALMQVPMVQAMLPPGRRVGLITISAETLSPEHLTRAGCPADMPIIGTDHGQEFSRVILGNETALDVSCAEADLLSAADKLIARHADVAAIVLECTNMPPYQAAVQERTGVPVFSMVDAVCWLQAGLRPRRWPLPATG